jgi:hypothetical protein
VEKKNPAEGGGSKPDPGHAGAGGRRYVTAVGCGGLESDAGIQPIHSGGSARGSGHFHLARLCRRPIWELPSNSAVP